METPNLMRKETVVLIKFISIYHIVNNDRDLKVKHVEYNKNKISTQKEIEIASSLSHELKTPLVPIIGFCKMLTKENMIGSLNEEQMRIIKIIEKNSNQLYHVISNITELKKIELGTIKLNRTKFSLDSFFKSLEKQIKNFEKNVKLQIKIDVKDDTVNTDKDRLEQIFKNILDNSFKFNENQNKDVKIGCVEVDGFYQFHVADSGIGIEPKEKEAIFEKFYLIDSSYTRKHKGVGLGLTVCKGLVEAMGGKIWVESELGKGTTFYFTIPKHLT